MDLEALLSGRARSSAKAGPSSGGKASRTSAVSAILGRDVGSRAQSVSTTPPVAYVHGAVGDAVRPVAASAATSPSPAASQPNVSTVADFDSSSDLFAAIQRDVHSLGGSATSGAAWSSSSTEGKPAEVGVPLPQRRGALAKLGKMFVGWDITELNCVDCPRLVSPGSPAARHPLLHHFAWLLLPADFEIDAVPSGVAALVDECSRVIPFRAHQLAAQRRAAASAHADGEGDDDDDDGESFTRGEPSSGGPADRHPALPGIFEGGDEEEDEEEADGPASERSADGSSGAHSRTGRSSERAKQQERWRCLYLLAAVGGALIPSLLLRACDPASETVRYAAVRLVSDKSIRAC